MLVLSVCLQVGCQKQPAEPVGAAQALPGPARVEVRVYADGTLTVDGAAASLDALAQRLDALVEARGVVWYYRESADAEPPEIASKVIALVIERRLPISMSTRSDFSDVVDEQGASRPRTP